MTGPMTGQRPAQTGTPGADHGAPRSLFVALLDDAAIFPPGNARMTTALQAHTARLRSPDALFVGCFLCSVTRLDELLTCLPADLPLLELSLVATGDPAELRTALTAIADSDRLQLRAVETRLAQDGVAPTLATLDALLPVGTLGYVEVPLDANVGGAVDTVAAAGHRVKLRTGGTTAAAFPSAASLARGMSACLAAGAPFKLTAGLHNPIRHRDPVTGFEHHGFLNVLAATGAGQDDDVAALASVLEEQDETSLASFARGLSDPAARALRSRFVAFGTCSTEEPLADLRGLGLLAQTA